MLISLCIPCRNRTADLRQVMPFLQERASEAPPVEIVVLDYNSPDDLEQYARSLAPGVVYRKYTGRDYYHMAHARNLSVLAASGEWIVISSSDIYFLPGFFPMLRRRIERGYDYMYDPIYKGVIAVRRQEFIEAGGYDERIEFYGPEDREIDARLRRRELKVGEMAKGYIRVIYTPQLAKISGYRLELSKQEMHRRGMEVYWDNDERRVTVANPDGWGAWQ